MVAVRPEGVPGVRSGRLTRTIQVVNGNGAALSGERRYVYLLYRQPSIIPENGDGEILQPCGSAEAEPRMRGEVIG